MNLCAPTAEAKLQACVLALGMVLTAGAIGAPYSALWGTNGELWSASGRLPDYSWAGYHSGRKPIPDVPVVANLASTGAIANDTNNDAGFLQMLINTAPTPGAILIPAGRWYINQRVNLNRSGIVLRGEPGAEFYMPQSLSEIDGADPFATQLYSNGTGFIVASGSRPTTVVGTVAANVAKGSVSLPLTSTAGLVVGEFLEITQSDPADKSLAIHLHGELNEMGATSYTQSSIYPQVFQWYVRVKAVNGNVLTVDMPLPLKIQTNWSPTVRKLTYSGFLTEVGIENLIIRAKGVVKNPHLDEAGWNGIQFSGVLNSWIRNVTFIDTDNGVLLGSKASFCTISHVVTKGDFRTAANHPNGEIGHHAIWATGGSSFNLITDFDIQTTYHHDLTCEGLAHHNVFMRGRGAKLNFDQHRNAPWANLFTDLDTTNAARLWASSGSSGRGPHTARELTAWGVRKASGAFPSVPSEAGMDGTNQNDWAFLNVVGLQGLTTNKPGRGDQWVELGGATPVQPQNIYLAQFAALHSPALNAISNRSILAGRTLTLTNNASDPDRPAQVLSYTLLNPPVGAMINATNGVFTWRPAIAQSPATNLPGVVVRDSGTPVLGATQTFLVTIARPVTPTISSAVAEAGGEFSFVVAGDAGPDYLILASTNLITWQPVWTNSSAVPPFQFTDPQATNFTQRFYHCLLLP